MALVSIVTSARNEERHLQGTIVNVLGQTLKEWEWIIVDDGSSDGTWEVLNRWAEREERLILFRNDSTEGLGRSLNKAIRASRGRYIARMDADDLCRPDRLERQCLFLDQNPQVGLVGSFNHVMDEGGRVLDTWRFQHTPEEIHYTLQFQNCLCHSSVMLRRRLLEEIGLYREDLPAAQDYELWLRVSHRSALYKIPEPLVSWRLRPGGISMARRDEQAAVAQEIALNNLSGLLGEPLPPRFLRTVLGRETHLTSEEREAFLVLLERLHAGIVRGAPQGVDVDRLRHLCRGRSKVLEIGLMWHGRTRDRYLHFPTQALGHLRLLPDVWRYLRKGSWSLG
ncbi:MAG: glycosyltransferase [Thermodesulfobacteriota bacterium]